MWIYTNSPNTPDYLTPGKLYEVIGTILGEYITDDDRDLIAYRLQGVRWSVLSDYHAKHLEG